MEIEIDDEKSLDSFQAEMDLVKEEEETENRLSQKERLYQMLSKIKPQNQPQNEANPNILRAAPKKVEVESSDPFDPNFNLNQRYFYQNINLNEWNEINQFIENYIEEDMTEKDLEDFFDAHPKISKGNVIQLQNAVEKIFSQKQNLEKYKTLINFIIKKYFKPKPVICECYFFPNPSNEQRVVNMFRTCKKTLDLAIFTFTRDYIAQAILEAYQRGVKVRCIGDDGNSKVKGSDVRLLASVGIPCKTDNNLRFHMHNKMAIIDNSVVITGSFNWTTQAVNKNQDNILFIEDKNIASQYTDYYNKIWESFNTVITPEEAKQYMENEKKAEQEKKAEKEKQAETTKKETEKKETNKETTKKDTDKKETAKKETAKKETTKKETTKKETTKKDTTKKETTKKEATKKETAKKEPTKKETTKKTSVSKEKDKKTTTKKSESKPKTSTTKKSESKSKSKDKKEPTKKKSTPSNKKETTKNTTTKKKTAEKKETNKKSKSVEKEKKKSTASSKAKTAKSKTQTSKPKTVKEKKKEKNEKRKPTVNKRVRGVKTNKEKNKK